MLFVDEQENSNGEESGPIIPTPPPDNEKQSKEQKDSVDDDRKFKKIRIDDDNKFYDENDNQLNSDLMWDFDYVSSHIDDDDNTQPDFYINI